MIIVKLLASVIILIQPAGFSVVDGNGQTFSCGENLLGSYEVGTNEISICEDGNMQTLIHELGHYVFFMKLNERQRQGWQKICGKEKVACYEEFAEAFRSRVNS